MMTELLGLALPLVQGIFNVNSQKRSLDRNRDLTDKYLDRQDYSVENMFNRDYYERSLESGYSQKLLKQVRDSVIGNNEASRNVAVVNGLPGETFESRQKEQRNNMAAVVQGVTWDDLAWKRDVLDNYMVNKAAIGDKRYMAAQEYYTNLTGVKDQYGMLGQEGLLKTWNRALNKTKY